MTRTAKGDATMPTCAACSAPLRDSAKFCTRCGTPVVAETPTGDAREPAPAEPAPVPGEVPARIAPERRSARVPSRSTAATWALVAGVAPLVVSVVGNVLSSQLGVAALAQIESGAVQGAWAPVLTVLALVFVGNAALLTVCAIMGVRGFRETSNGITRGRALAVAGLAAGGVNLVLWVAGLVVTVSGLNVVLA